MRLAASLALLLVLSLPASSQAASYVQIDFTIVDPILDIIGDPHVYSGPNLKPGADLGNAILTGAILSDADLSYAFLDAADLSYAILTGANLSNADLYYANLPFANLSSANLSHAFLVAADLSYAILTGANLSNADLYYANLSSANLSDAFLVAADLTGATYNEVTTFPSGGDIYSRDWGLPGAATPWGLLMVPAPEPASGAMLCVGCLALAVLGRQ